MGYFYSFYTPPTRTDDVGVCGVGSHYQAMIQRTQNPHIELLSSAEKGSPNYFRELAELVERTNTEFERRAVPLLEKKRAELGEPTLEITIFLAKDGLQLTYAVPLEKRKGGHPRPTIARAKPRAILRRRKRASQR